MAGQARRQIIDSGVQTDVALLADDAAVHLAPPGFGKIVREQGRRYWQAL